MNADTFCGQMLIALQKKGPKPGRPGPVDCTDRSKYDAAHTCAALALVPTLGQVALIPRKNQHGQVECHVMPQWQGYKAIMERSPDILEVTPVLVHKTDNIQWSQDGVIHDYDPFNGSRKFNGIEDIKGGYLKIEYRNGRADKYFPVTADYIRKCKNCAETDMVWKSWFEQQALKTIIRAAYARRAVPIDPLVAQAMEHATTSDDAALGNNPNILDAEFTPSEPKPISTPEELTERLNRDADKAESPPKMEPQTVVDESEDDTEIEQPSKTVWDDIEERIKGAVRAKKIGLIDSVFTEYANFVEFDDGDRADLERICEDGKQAIRDKKNKKPTTDQSELPI